MILVRPEPEGVMLFQAARARTGLVGGVSLQALARWVQTGARDPFVERLFALGLLCEEVEQPGLKDRVGACIAASRGCSAPRRSFRVPESVHIDLTSRCGLDCAQCYRGAGGAAGQDEDLPEGGLRRLVAEASGVGVFQVAFGGGEPLLYPALEAAVRLVADTGMACSLTTSGQGLSEARAWALREAGLHHVQVSLNGSTAEVHGRSRGGFEAGRAALEVLSRMGQVAIGAGEVGAGAGAGVMPGGRGALSFGINWTARRDNLADLPAVIGLAQRLGAGNVNVLRLKPEPSGRWRDQVLGEEETRALAAMLKPVRGPLVIKLDSAYSCLIQLMWPGGRGPGTAGCAAGRRFISVDVRGRFQPCSHLGLGEEAEGIEAYWRGSRVLEELRQAEERLGGKCSSCRFVAACRGCAAVCRAEGGGLLGGEQACAAWQERGSREGVSR